MAVQKLTITLISFQTLLLFSGVNSIDRDYYYNNNFNNICKEYKSWVPTICGSLPLATGGECKSMSMEFNSEYEGLGLEAATMAACTDEDGDIVYCASTSTTDTTFLVYNFVVQGRAGHCSGSYEEQPMPQDVVAAIRRSRDKKNSGWRNFFGSS